MYSLKFLLVGIFLLVVGIAFQVDVILATASHNDFGQLFQLQQTLALFLIGFGILVGLCGCIMPLTLTPVKTPQSSQGPATAAPTDTTEENAHP